MDGPLCGGFYAAPIGGFNRGVRRWIMVTSWLAAISYEE